MDSTQNALYRVHQLHAERLGEVALPYEEFQRRVLTAYETGFTGLLSPSLGAKLKIQMKFNTRFAFGRQYVTEAVAAAVPADELLKAVERHAAGDWGLLDQNDWENNDKALREGGRLFSRYQSSAGQKFWVVTEADRKVTTVLLPEDY